MEIGKRIQKKREALGLSQKDLAKKLDISWMTIHRLETGHSVRPYTLAAIKTELGMSGKRLTKPRKMFKAGRMEPAKTAPAADATLKALGLLLGGINRLSGAVESLHTFLKLEAARDRERLAEAVHGGDLPNGVTVSVPAPTGPIAY